MLTNNDSSVQISDILCETRIRSYLDSNLDYLTVEVFDSVESTNDICRQAADNKSEYVVVSGHQSKGRGRLGRSFFSPANTGLYMSFLLKNPPFSTEDTTKITTMAAVSVCEAIEEVSDKKALIKWVNDVFVSNRKICGILTEASPSLKENKLEYAILGIGINVYMPEIGFPEDIANKAGAIFETKVMNGRNRLASYVINHFMKYYKGEKKNYIEEYRRRCFILGQDIIVVSGNKQKKATAVDIDDSCRLIVRYDDNNLETLYSGEILLPSLSENIGKSSNFGI